jgi:peptidoglycan/LPS O-acetylase OafA/YrhL
MQNLQLDDILQLLALGSGINALWSIFLYLVFFLALVTLFTMPDKNMVPTLLIAVVLLCSVVAKISLASSDPIFKQREFGMMIINVAMGVLPFIVAGMIRRGKTRRTTAVPLAIFTGIIGTVYFLMFLIFVQRG